MTPFKIVAYESGAADVYDRESGDMLGYILRDFHGWWSARGRGNQWLGTFPTRRDAARLVWEAASETGGRD